MNKFLSLYKVLNKDMQFKFLIYARNEAFNTSKKIEYLIQFLTQEEIVLDKDTLYGLIFKDENYEDGKLRNLLSRANSLLQKFLAIQTLEANSNM